MNEISEALTHAEARQLTDAVKADAASLWAKLLRLYEGGAHRALGYASWGAYFTAEFRQASSYGYRLLEAARVQDVLADSPMGESVSTVQERQARALAPLLDTPPLLRAAWQEATARSDGQPTAATVREVVNEQRAVADGPGVVPLPPTADPLAVHFTSDSPEWYTPPHIITRVLRVLGHIDLDPCSNGGLTPAVPADQHYTETDDGLSQPRFGRIYLNPPYGDGISPWVRTLCAAYQVGEVTAAVALVPARTETAWFRRFRDYPRCFITGRLHFSEHENSAPFPSAAVYLGPDTDGFVAAFGDVGAVFVRVSP